MNRKTVLNILLLAFVTLACGIGGNSAAGLEGSSADLPTIGPHILYQPGLLDSGKSDPDNGLFLLDVAGETVTRWTPSGEGELDIWSLASDEYIFFTQSRSSDDARRLIFVGNNGRFASYNINPFSRLSADGRYHVDTIRPAVTIRPVNEETGQAVAEATSGFPKWSADGGKVLFVEEASDDLNRLILYHPRSGEEIVVLETEAVIRNKLWSPDGSAFAFVTYLGTDLTLHQFSGDGRTQLTADILPQEGVLTYAPDGRSVWLAAGVGRRSTFDRFPSSGSGGEVMADIEGGVDNIRFSPDGRWLFFEAQRIESQEIVEIYIVPLDNESGSVGGSPIFYQVPAFLSRVITAEFSPDNQKIAFIAGPDNPRTGVDALWIIDLTRPEDSPQLLVPQGSVPQEVWVDGDNPFVGYAGASNFVWLPDSASLYIAASLEDSCETENTLAFDLVPHTDIDIDCRFRFYQVNADGSGFRQIGDFETAALPEMRSNLSWLP